MKIIQKFEGTDRRYSIKVDIELIEKIPPEYLYHGNGI